MKHYQKLCMFFLFLIMIVLGGCVIPDPKLYQAKPGPTALLIIDIPTSFDAEIVGRYDRATEWDWNGSDISLIYDSKGSSVAPNRKLKINANKPFYFIYSQNSNNKEFQCILRAYFIPQADKVYYLTSGTIDPSKQSIIKSLISPDYGKCYVAVSQIENGRVTNIKLNNY